MEQKDLLKTAMENPDAASESNLTMMKTMDTLTIGLGRAMVFVQDDGTIGICNQKMKEILGLKLRHDRSHEMGRIEKGDIVIIADNEIGSDDKLMPADLEKINIFDTEIVNGDALIAIGIYGDNSKSPAYKFFHTQSHEQKIGLTERIGTCEVTAEIDFSNNFTCISVNGESYRMPYQESIGNIVVLDGKDYHVKFFQDFGYDLRGEEIGELLRGGIFQQKGILNEQEDDSINGKSLHEVIYGTAFLDTVSELFMEGDGAVKEGIFDINRILMYCRMIRIKNGGSMDGVHIFFQTSENMMQVHFYGSSIISELERRRKIKNPIVLHTQGKELDKFIGNEPEMAAVKNMAYKASRQPFNVVITGESGTGKSLLAREIHKLQYGDSSKAAPFVEVTCNAIAPTLFESELFGYVAGAFTGAAPGGKAGFFEEANGGTIFLDEIGELPLDIQTKLLDVLQNKRIYRVGSTRPIHVDVRVITATNKNLKEEVAKGNFRQDLYYRINVLPIHIPPLRQRRQDLNKLIYTVLETACSQYNMNPKQISAEAMGILMAYSWPGNVRELENVMERALTLCDGNIIYKEHLILEEDAQIDLMDTGSMKERLAAEEKKILTEVLNKHNRDIRKVMEELNLTKSVLYGRIKTYGL